VLLIVLCLPSPIVQHPTVEVAVTEAVVTATKLQDRSSTASCSTTQQGHYILTFLVNLPAALELFYYLLLTMYHVCRVHSIIFQCVTIYCEGC